MLKRKNLLWFALIASVIITACGGGDSQSDATEEIVIPTEADTLVPSITPSARPSTTPIPTLPPTFTAEADAIEPTITPIRVTVEPLTGEQIPPPITIDLPDGWEPWYDTLIYESVEGDLTTTRFAAYFGPLNEGVGSIVVLWGFPSTATFNPVTGESEVINFYLQGVRLFNLIIAEIGCNTSLGDEQQFNVGEYDAMGSSITAIDCPEYPDLGGWFAGLQVDGVNFLFYTYVEPDEALNTSAVDALQGILNDVEFNVPEVLQTLQAEITAEVTLDVTPQAEVTDEP